MKLPSSVRRLAPPRSVKAGCEISFSRHFYQPRPIRPLEEIQADIMALESETERLPAEIIRQWLSREEYMATLNIFVSFEFDKDKDLQNNFYRQARDLTQHRIRDCSLHESYPDEAWKRKARNAIGGCDVVVVLIGQDTHNAPGIIVETDIARSLHKPIIQVRPQGRPYQGLTRLGEPIPWRWRDINAELDALENRRR